MQPVHVSYDTAKLNMCYVLNPILRVCKWHICRSSAKPWAFEHTFFPLCVWSSTTWWDLLLTWIYVTLFLGGRRGLSLFSHHVQQKCSIRSLMAIKQIKKWIKVDRSSVWFNVHPVLKHNQAEWSNRDTAYPEVQTNKCLGRVPWGPKVALKSTVAFGLWVIRLNGNELWGSCTVSTDECVFSLQMHTADKCETSALPHNQRPVLIVEAKHSAPHFFLFHNKNRKMFYSLHKAACTVYRHTCKVHSSVFQFLKSLRFEELNDPLGF